MRDSCAVFLHARTKSGITRSGGVCAYVRRRSSSGLWISALAVLCVLADGQILVADPVVNLELVTATPTIDVGSLVEVQMLARAEDDQDIPIVAVQALLNWDSNVLRLAGVIDNVAPEYEWFLSGFFNDIGIDNLNDGVTTPPFGLPFNDGDASFEALGQFPPGSWPVARPGGTRITTLVFEALRAAAPTKIAIPLSAGEFTTSGVFWGEGAPGVNILGDTSNVLITVVPEPSTLVIVMLGLVGFCRARGRRIQ